MPGETQQPGIWFGYSIPAKTAGRSTLNGGGAELAGRTAIGRITIQVLAINEPDFLAVREALIEEQIFRQE